MAVDDQHRESAKCSGPKQEDEAWGLADLVRGDADCGVS